MDKILEIFAQFDVLSGAVTLVVAGLVWLLTKVPAKLRPFFVEVIDKTDAELDKEKEKK